MRKFTYDMFDTISPPTLVLSTRYHKHLGVINNAQEVSSEFNMSSHQEISFEVYKEVDGVQCPLWDDIVDFKYVYVPEHEEYYELQVDVDDADSTKKHCTGVSASERELSQKYLRDFHCNDETDILRDDYVVTILYDPNNPDGSLLDRVLHDKCPEWTIAHVDSSIADIQRTFTTDNTTVYDFFVNTVAKEIGCLFLFNSVNRSISVYDLYNTCDNCGFRGEYQNKCPKCGSTSLAGSYGTFQNVYISPKNFASQISVDGDADSVKNCFKIEGGDDLMTATVANLNPNSSNYIYRFSNDMISEMPEELQQKLEEYYTLYNDTLPTYKNLTEDYYDAINQELYLQTEMSPETPIPEDTTAQEQLDLLMTETFTVSMQDIDNIVKENADLAVQNYARTLIDPRYTVKVSDSTISNVNDGIRTWRGKFTVTSLGKLNDDGTEESATSSTKKNVAIDENYEDFLKQKILKSLDRTDYGFMTIFTIEDDEDFVDALREYSLDRLNSFANTYQSALEILVKQGVSNMDKVNGDNEEYLSRVQVYHDMYEPYYERKGWIDREIQRRSEEIKIVQTLKKELERQRKQIQKQLNLQKYLGSRLYKIFTLYLREDTYTNSNYISDGLNNSELIDKANELFAVAETELYKASELQYSLSGTLQNFLNTEEFANFKDKFEIGDWIICEADDRIYKLRLTNVSYSYNSPENINVTFSNASRVGGMITDVKDILNKSASMATSYNYVAHQASQGNKAQSTVDGFLKQGLDSALIQVLSGENQEITIDEHGLTGKEYVDTIDDYSPCQVKLTSSMLAFTKDNWETASLGLGKHQYSKYDENNHTFVIDEDYGLSSTFVQAGYIWGSQIIAGDLYSTNFDDVNKTGTHIDLNNGDFSFAGEGLTFDGTHLYLGGFEVVPGGLKTESIYIESDGKIESEYLVGQIDETDGYDLHGEIFNTYTDGILPSTPNRKFNMKNITKFKQSAVDVIASSTQTTQITWDGTSDDIEETFYYTTPIDVTDWNYITYRLETIDRNRDSAADDAPHNLQIGISTTPPTGIIDDSLSHIITAHNWEKGKEYKTAPKTFFDYLDVSQVTGNVYLIVNAHGWDALLRKVRLSNYVGTANKAINVQSHAEGNGTTASGAQSHGEGNMTTASGAQSHSEGNSTTASGAQSHSEGSGSLAVNSQAHAEGDHTLSSGSASHSEGYYCNANGNYSHAEGQSTRATNNASHSEGYNTQSHGIGSHSEGRNTVSTYDGSHAEGDATACYARGGHSEGIGTTVTGSAEAGHTEGYYTTSSGDDGSHAEGRRTTASGDYGSHAEGDGTTASGMYGSHAEGKGSVASGSSSHAEGYYTISTGLNQHVEGKYNISDPNSTYAHIVGNGTSDSTRSNAYALDWSGNAVYAGKVTVGTAPTNNMDVATKKYVDDHSGGTTVIPNPQGTPTDTLNSVSIDGTIYGILSGALYGTTSPTSNMGVNGTIYVQYSATENVIKYVYCKINGIWMLFPFAYDENTFVDDEGNTMETDDGNSLIFVD